MNEEYVLFLEENKNISSSPRLLLQTLNIEKKYQWKQKSMSAFHISSTSNKVDQSKSVYVVNSPTVSVFHTSPNIILDMLFALFFSFILTFGFIV